MGEKFQQMVVNNFINIKYKTNNHLNLLNL